MRRYVSGTKGIRFTGHKLDQVPISTVVSQCVDDSWHKKAGIRAWYCTRNDSPEEIQILVPAIDCGYLVPWTAKGVLGKEPANTCKVSPRSLHADGMFGRREMPIKIYGLTVGAQTVRLGSVEAQVCAGPKRLLTQLLHASTARSARPMWKGRQVGRTAEPHHLSCRHAECGMPRPARQLPPLRP